MSHSHGAAWGQHVRRDPQSTTTSVSTQLSRAAGGVIKSKGRGMVATPQQLVVVSATVNKDERELRARNATGNPRDVYGLPSKSDADMSVFKGLLGLANPGHGSTFRPGLGNTNHATWTANMANASRSDNYCVPSVVQNSRSAEDKDSENLATLVVHGVQTVVNTGLKPIACGQHLYVDPNPATTKVDGQVVSAIEIAGIPADVLFVQVCPLASNTQHTHIRLINDRSRVALGTMDFSEAIRRGDSRILTTALRRTIRAGLFTDQSIAEDMPLRDYALLYAINLLHQLVYIPDGISRLVDADRPLLAVLAIQSHVEIMRALSYADCRIYADFAASLPQNTNTEQVYKSDESNVHGVTLSRLVASSNLLTSATRTALHVHNDMNEARARVALHHADQIDMLHFAQSAYMRKFYLGTALSGANKGGQLDIMMC